MKFNWLSKELSETDYSPESLNKLNDYIVGTSVVRLTPSEVATVERLRAQIVLLLDSQPRAVRREIAVHVFNAFIKTYY